jgi:hypothetical protein
VAVLDGLLDDETTDAACSADDEHDERWLGHTAPSA